MPYKLNLYWRDNVPGDIVEATADEIHSLLVHGLAEEVVTDAPDAAVDAGSGSDDNNVSPDAAPE